MIDLLFLYQASTPPILWRSHWKTPLGVLRTGLSTGVTQYLPFPLETPIGALRTGLSNGETQYFPLPPTLPNSQPKGPPGLGYIEDRLENPK